jgi:plasmid stabilization system protein ParE
VRVLFTRTAREPYLAALAEIAQDRPAAARRLHARARRALSRLASFPDSGRPIPEFPELPHREVVLPPWRFFYRVQGRTVWIVAVWHDAQLPGAPALAG